ncbi:Glutamine-Leucine-Glutamine QLQ [Arabidopsis thaliana x Arabidopsis arenosa]|uniref:Growth-regulating factor n=1 Tax=Arabidopsis thaliana x Arabidopsis arenosa TaxID=1240361 RepID=A0A8T2A3W9_9BRAS|nr:Glutamine-Leucine-Glutamine QLQ [Arabidopsis thaliana x Arabidopsis arenosa]
MDLGVRVSGHENGSSPGQTELGSGFSNKQERSGFDGEDCWRSSKLSRTSSNDVFSSSSASAKTLSFHQGIPLLRSTTIDPRKGQEHMLSFSSTSDKSDVSPYLQYCRNSGYGLGGMMNTSNMHGNLLTGVKGPFSLTQWAELEQQALIYKYITANVPVPSSLLLSLKKSFFPYGSLPPNSFGWGSFHLGFSGGNMDPEPGRCRRTDGKKWRCSRDAVPDQKYCERHINRGRHRSRKPVEGQNGHNTNAAAASAAASTAAAVSKAAAGTSAIAMRGSDNNNSLAAAIGTHHHANNQSTDSLANRVQNSRGASVFPATINLQSKETHPKQSNNPFEFGLISSDSLLNPSHKQASYANSSKGFGSYLDFSNQAKHVGNHHNDDSWPEELKSDWTQLSMSIPMAPSSPVQDKLALSPLRLSREFDPAIHMGLGVNTEFLEPEKKTNNWIPISWGNNNSMGGPLGEVLNSTTNSPKFGSSPTGVLQKSTFGSLSNSSSGSSTIIGDNNNKNGDGKDPLGPTTLMNTSATAPSL